MSIDYSEFVEMLKANDFVKSVKVNHNSIQYDDDEFGKEFDEDYQEIWQLGNKEIIINYPIYEDDSEEIIFSHSKIVYSYDDAKEYFIEKYIGVQKVAKHDD